MGTKNLSIQDHHGSHTIAEPSTVHIAGSSDYQGGYLLTVEKQPHTFEPGTEIEVLCSNSMYFYMKTPQGFIAIERHEIANLIVEKKH